MSKGFFFINLFDSFSINPPKEKRVENNKDTLLIFSRLYFENDFFPGDSPENLLVHHHYHIFFSFFFFNLSKKTLKNPFYNFTIDCIIIIIIALSQPILDLN